MISCGKQFGLAGGRIERPLQPDLEFLLLGPRAVIGEIEAFLDERVEIDRPALAGTFARMQQHVLDDRVGALAVLHHLFEIAFQHLVNSSISCSLLVVERRGFESVAQFIDKFDRERREIVDEIEWVLDLVRDAGGELTERGELLRLNQAVLCGTQFLQRLRQFARARFNAFEQAGVFNRECRLEPRTSEADQRCVSGIRRAACAGRRVRQRFGRHVATARSTRRGNRRGQ